MYPMIRLAKQLFLQRNAQPISTGETHIAHMMAWPWDIDVFLDLNNGRVLTLMDLGRMGYFKRAGVLPILKQRGWYGTVAGSVIRYRRRITMFQRLELRTRLLGWDDRFIYFEQAFWTKGDCAAHAVVRTALTTGKGIVPPADMAEALGEGASPDLPEWVQDWRAAENKRSWPPEF